MGDEVRRGGRDRLGHRLTSPSEYTAALPRNRALTVVAMAGLIAAAWGYTAYLAFDMRSVGMPSLIAAAGAPAVMAWQPTDFVFVLVMWSVMMVAMMLPSATPMILLIVFSARRMSGCYKVIVAPRLAGAFSAADASRQGRRSARSSPVSSAGCRERFWGRRSRLRNGYLHRSRCRRLGRLGELQLDPLRRRLVQRLSTRPPHSLRRVPDESRVAR